MINIQRTKQLDSLILLKKGENIKQVSNELRKAIKEKADVKV